MTKCTTPIICAHFGCAYRDERREAMACPPCNHDCNQGRLCPSRRKRKFTLGAKLFLFGIVATALKLVWMLAQ